MKRSVFKWILGISIFVLVLLIVFTVAIWALGNAAGAFAGAIMGSLDSENFGYQYLPFDEFLAGVVGSPIFYVYIVDLAALITSAVMLIVKRKR